MCGNTFIKNVLAFITRYFFLDTCISPRERGCRRGGKSSPEAAIRAPQRCQAHGEHTAQPGAPRHRATTSPPGGDDISRRAVAVSRHTPPPAWPQADLPRYAAPGWHRSCDSPCGDRCDSRPRRPHAHHPQPRHASGRVLPTTPEARQGRLLNERRCHDDPCTGRSGRADTPRLPNIAASGWRSLICI